jgi:cell division protein FtsL
MKKIFIITIIVNLILIMGQLVLSAKRATDGDALAKISAEIAQIDLENQDLKSKIYAYSSLENIEKRAAELSLSHVQAQFLNLSQPVAAAK